jgi:hypothetical protein
MSNETSEIKEDVENIVEESAKHQQVENEQNEDIDAKLYAQKVELLKQKQKIYFMILCYPYSDKYGNDIRGLHLVGLFSSVEKAMEYIPISRKSYSNGVSWLYSLWPVNSDTNIDFRMLDRKFSAFPYKSN